MLKAASNASAELTVLNASEQTSSRTLDAAVDALHRILDTAPHPIFVKDETHRGGVLNESMRDDLVPQEQANIVRKQDRGTCL